MFQHREVFTLRSCTFSFPYSSHLMIEITLICHCPYIPTENTTQYYDLFNILYKYNRFISTNTGYYFSPPKFETKYKNLATFFKDLLRYLLARKGVNAPFGPAFLAHAMQKVRYIVDLTVLRLAFFMGYE